MKHTKWMFAGLIALILLEISKVYFIMPLPGSQKMNSLGFAYFLNDNLWWIRLIIIILLIGPLVHHFKSAKKWIRITAGILLLVYGVVYYAFHYEMLAEKMFIQPGVLKFAPAAADSNQQKLVIGVSVKNIARAYPVEIIGYHHQVRDTLNGEQIMVTYCTVCRSGRVFSPVINGQPENFRLVGMDHFNAMFEDETTKSWWQQATGKAIIGPMKGYQLDEIDSKQMRLGEWLSLYPNSEIMLQDPKFKAEYDSLKGYDEGKKRRDTTAWQRKSWVIGVSIDQHSRAYDWNGLEKVLWLEDSIASTPLLVTMEANKKTHYVMFRQIDGMTLHFAMDSVSGKLKDKETSSFWQPNGLSVNGPLKGKQMSHIQSYQEYWHSWKQFHPESDQFK